MHRWNIRRAVGATGRVAEHELRAGVPQNEMDGLAGELEIHRNRDEAGAHDAVVSGDKFRPIGGENADAIPARGQPPRDAVSHVVDLAKREFARDLLAAEIDDRDLVEIAIARNEVAEV